MVDTQFYINKGPFSLRQIAEICEAELADAGKADVVIKDIATMPERRKSVSFMIRKPKEKPQKSKLPLV